MDNSENLKTIILGGGCFWCTEAIFSRIAGVADATPWYVGGHTKNPTYAEVCHGDTGHAEAVRIIYDPAIVLLEKLLSLFFASHDPTTPNRQGADVGTQYRSVIFAEDDEMLARIKNHVDSVRSRYTAPIVTELGISPHFYEAEPEHKKYYDRYPERSYCAYVIAPKLEKVFGEA